MFMILYAEAVSFVFWLFLIGIPKDLFPLREMLVSFCLIVPYVKLPCYKLLWNNKIIVQ